MKQAQQLQHSEKWLTSKGIADYCMVSRVTVRRWIKGGKLTAIKLPSGHFRVTLVDFRAFLERWNIPVEDWLLEESKS